MYRAYKNQRSKYLIDIIKNVIKNEKIDFQKYKKIEFLFNQEEFFVYANTFINKFSKIYWSNHLKNTYNLTFNAIKNDLLDLALNNLINSITWQTEEILNKKKNFLNNPETQNEIIFINEYLKIKKVSWIFIVEDLNLWKIRKFKKLNISFFDELWVIFASIDWEKQVILDETWKEITKKTSNYQVIIAYKYFWKIFFKAKQKEKWRVVLDNKAKQISENWIYYEEIDLNYFEKTWLILAQEKDKWAVILNSSFAQISKKWVYYEELILWRLEKTWLIIAKEKWKWKKFLDKYANNVGNEQEYFDNVDLNYYESKWLIIVSKNNQKIILDKNMRKLGDYK